MSPWEREIEDPKTWSNTDREGTKGSAGVWPEVWADRISFHPQQSMLQPGASTSTSRGNEPIGNAGPHIYLHAARKEWVCRSCCFLLHSALAFCYITASRSFLTQLGAPKSSLVSACTTSPKKSFKNKIKSMHKAIYKLKSGVIPLSKFNSSVNTILSSLLTSLSCMQHRSVSSPDSETLHSSPTHDFALCYPSFAVIFTTHTHTKNIKTTNHQKPTSNSQPLPQGNVL